MKTIPNSSISVAAGLVCGLFIFAQPLHAELLVSDSFQVAGSGDDAAGVYAEGKIGGQSPATLGFDPESVWSGAGKGLENVADVVGLEHEGFNARGGSFLSKIKDRINYQTTRNTNVTLDSQPEQLFFAFLVQKTSTDDPGKAGINFGRSGSGASTSGPLEVGIAGAEYSVTFSSSSGNKTEITSDAGYTAGDTALLVLQLDINSGDGDDDQWYLYANPDLSAAPDTGSAVLSGKGQLWGADTTFGAVQPRVSGASGPIGNWRIDEVRIADDFSSLSNPE